MQNLKKILFVALIFTLATIGCKKTDDNTGDDSPNESGTCYVNKMDYGTDGYDEVMYNSDHLISSFVNYKADGTADGFVNSINYDGTKLLTITSADNGNVKAKFEYKYSNTSNPDSAIMWEDKGNGKLERTAFGLTFSDDKLVKAESYFEVLGQSVVIAKIEFTYSGDNLSEYKTYKFKVSSLQMELESTINFEYDSKKNPMHGVGLDFFFFETDIPFMSKNNITKCTYKDASGTVDQSKSFTNAIEYNTNNYPSKITTNYNDGSKSNAVTYSYDCQ